VRAQCRAPRRERRPIYHAPYVAHQDVERKDRRIPNWKRLANWTELAPELDRHPVPPAANEPLFFARRALAVRLDAPAAGALRAGPGRALAIRSGRSSSGAPTFHGFRGFSPTPDSRRCASTGGDRRLARRPRGGPPRDVDARRRSRSGPCASACAATTSRWSDAARRDARRAGPARRPISPRSCSGPGRGRRDVLRELQVAHWKETLARAVRLHVGCTNAESRSGLVSPAARSRRPSTPPATRRSFMRPGRRSLAPEQCATDERTPGHRLAHVARTPSTRARRAAIRCRRSDRSCDRKPWPPAVAPA